MYRVFSAETFAFFDLLGLDDKRGERIPEEYDSEEIPQKERQEERSDQNVCRNGSHSSIRSFPHSAFGLELSLFFLSSSVLS